VEGGRGVLSGAVRPHCPAEKQKQALESTLQDKIAASELGHGKIKPVLITNRFRTCSRVRVYPLVTGQTLYAAIFVPALVS
jgi:hypothetical protein